MKSKTSVTLDRVLSRMGLASRTSAGEMIHAGRLKVNGRTVRDPEAWVEPDRDVIQLDGRRLRPARRVYLLFYKPKGVITSYGDPGGRKTVYDCLARTGRGVNVPEAGANRAGMPRKPAGMKGWVFPVGRLDKDTSGLLLLTNDTAFADFVTSPEAGIPKTYLVKASGLVSDELIQQLRLGMRMKRGDWASPESVRRVEDRGKYTWLEVELTEGKNREVRRMIEAVGFKVLKLVRTGIGPLTLEGLEVGSWRELTRPELAALRQSRVRPRRGSPIAV